MKIPKNLKPEHVTVICDTREQLPLDLSPLAMVRGTLDTGDYSVLGLEKKIAVERKSLQDLIGCIGRERERFDREMQRILAYPHRAVFVEESLDKIDLKMYRGLVHPNAVYGSIVGWMARGIPIIFCSSRQQAAYMLSRFLFVATQRLWQENLDLLERVLKAPAESTAPQVPVI